MTQSRHDLVSIAESYKEMWNTGDFSKLELVAESVDVYHPSHPEGHINGRDPLQEFVRAMRKGFPDIHVTTNDVLAGDDVVMVEWTMTGTNNGEFYDLPATGRELELDGMSKLRIQDGKVQEDRFYFNQLDTFEQLGLTDD